MTPEQEHLIAVAAVELHDCRADLNITEARGNVQVARDHRRAVTDAERRLNEAIDAAVQR